MWYKAYHLVMASVENGEKPKTTKSLWNLSSPRRQVRNLHPVETTKTVSKSMRVSLLESQSANLTSCLAYT